MSTWYEIMMMLRAMLEEDPMEPDYDELARRAEPTSQYQDDYESAEAR